MSNGKAEIRKTEIDKINSTDISKRQLFGLHRRNLSVKTSTVITGTSLSSGGGSSGGGSSGGVTPGDNLGNHLATQDLDLNFNFLSRFIGWTSATNQGEIIGDGGLDWFLDDSESYRWHINDGIDNIPLMELTGFGFVFYNMYYGVDFEDNYMAIAERHYPGAAPTGEKRIYVDEDSGLLSLTNSSGDILPIEQQYVSINYVIDGGGAVITTGAKGGVWVDFNLEVLYATISDDTFPGFATVTVKQGSSSVFPTLQTMGNITLSGGYRAQLLVSPTWSNTSVYGEGIQKYIGFVVVSASTVKRLTISLKCRRLT